MSGIAFPTDASAGSPSYAALAHRLARLVEFTSDGTTLGTLGGLRPGGQPVGSISVLQVTIPPFACLVDAGSSQGSYECAFTANEVVNLNARPGSNSRIDRIECQVPTDPPTGGIRVANIIYTAGSPSASPSPPAPNARCATVGFVTVPSVGTITWSTPNIFAVAAGGVMPVTSSAAYPSTPFEGQVIYDAVLDRILVADQSAAWRAYTPASTVGYNGGTTATLPAPTANADTPITTWVTSGQPSFLDGTDLTYSAGEVTSAAGGRYLCGLTVSFPSSAAAYRCQQFIMLNGSSINEGMASYNAVSGGGSQTLSGSAVVKLAAGDKIKFGVNISTSGCTGIAPRSFSLVRVA